MQELLKIRRLVNAIFYIISKINDNSDDNNNKIMQK